MISSNLYKTATIHLMVFAFLIIGCGKASEYKHDNKIIGVDVYYNINYSSDDLYSFKLSKNSLKKFIGLFPDEKEIRVTVGVLNFSPWPRCFSVRYSSGKILTFHFMNSNKKILHTNDLPRGEGWIDLPDEKLYEFFIEQLVEKSNGEFKGFYGGS